MMKGRISPPPFNGEKMDNLWLNFNFGYKTNEFWVIPNQKGFLDGLSPYKHDCRVTASTN
jgi:hypothetical protein